MLTADTLHTTTSKHPAGLSRQHAKDRARIRAMREGVPISVVKQSFADMSPSYRVEKAQPGLEDVVFTARPVEAPTNPMRFGAETYQQKVRAATRWDEMVKVCEETPPPEDTIKARHDRALWWRDPGVLIALRKYKTLGEKPSGRYSWVADVLRNDMVAALENGGDAKWQPTGDDRRRVSGGDMPIAYHVLEFLKNRWAGSAHSEGCTDWRWGNEHAVSWHVNHRQGSLTHYSYPGLSSPESEILRQYQIFRRFQEHETQCRHTLREEFGFEFIEPPRRLL